jgi:hypothetical protein
LLKRLALRNGYECYVEGKTGFFRAPRLAGTPQPALAVHFGAEGNVNRFSVGVNALAPTGVTMFQVGRGNKQVIEETATSSRQRALGAMRPSDFLRPGIPAGRMYVGMNAATGMPEMAALCHELLQQSEWFVAAEGEIDGKRYGHLLKPHGTVTIKGVGATYSGVYYVSHVTHVFTPKGYTQFFRARRNALMPTGGENFDGAAKPNPHL